jgi:hypothetical protein
VRELAGQYGPEAIHKLGKIMQESTSAACQLAASREILDRWVGRPPQAITDADGGNLPTVPQVVQYLLHVQQSSSQAGPTLLLP